MSNLTHTISKQEAERNLKLMNYLSFLSHFRTYAAILVIYFITITETAALAMTVLVVAHISSALFELPTGILSDHIGRKRTLMLHHFVEVFTIVVMYFAYTPEMLFIATALMGLSMALGSGTIDAFMKENLIALDKDTTDDFMQYNGRRTKRGRQALVLSAITGAVLMYFYDMKIAIAASVVAIIIAASLSFFLVDTPTNKPIAKNKFANFLEAWNEFHFDTFLKNISIGKVLATGLGNAEHRLRSVLYESIMPVWLINIFQMLNDIIIGETMSRTRNIVKKFGFMRSLVQFEVIHRISAIALLLMISTIGAFILVDSYPLINIATIGALALTCFVGVSFGIQFTASNALLQQSYRDNARATMGSIVGLGGSIVYAIVGVGAGFMIDHFGIFYTLVFFQLILLIPVFFFREAIMQTEDVVQPLTESS